MKQLFEDLGIKNTSVPLMYGTSFAHPLLVPEYPFPLTSSWPAESSLKSVSLAVLGLVVMDSAGQ